MPSLRTLRSFAWGLSLLLSVSAARAVGTPVYSEPFETYGAPGEPPGWFDSSPGHPGNEAPGQFKVWNDPTLAGNHAFGHKGASESYSHYRARTFAAADGFRFEGRLLRTKSKAHLGVTFLSDFPVRDEHYRLALTNDNGTVRLEGRGSGSANGDTESDVSLSLNVWYRFVVEVAKEGSLQRIRAKVWKQGQGEPAAWQIDATDSSGERPTGWIGVWAEGSGEKYWDDLNVSSSAAVDQDPPSIQITEGGSVLVDGALFARSVVPTIQVVDASPVTSSATLDAQLFASGTAVSAEGSHTLVVSATDAAGNSATKTVHFTIDTTAPVFVSILPPNGSLTRDPSVVLSGQVTGAATLSIDGAPTALSGTSFSSAVLPLADGVRTIPLVAADAAGNSTTFLYRIERDSLAPQISIASPASPVVGSAPIEVSGTATDAHLASVSVGGAAATLSGSTFSRAGVPLVEGGNSIAVQATDAAGNVANLSISVVLDTQPPVVTITEEEPGQPAQPLVDGSRFHRDVTPRFTATDATELSVVARLDGVAFVSGSTVSEEGPHEVSVEALDAAGHRTARLLRFEIDRTPPEISGLDPEEGSLLRTSPVVIHGRAAAAASVSVGGRPATLSGELFTSAPIDLSDGANTLAIAAEDAAGNRTLATLHLILDTAPPALSIDEPAEAAVLGASPITVAGSASDPHLEGVRVGGIEAVLAAGTYRRDGVPLAAGANTLVVEARDGAGNTTRLERHVVLDADPPVVRLLVAGAELLDGARFAQAISVAIEVEDATATTVEARLDGTPYASGAAIGTDGVHTLSVVATDAAGHRTARAVEFSIDASAPVFGAVAPEDGTILSAAQVSISGRVTDATSVEVDGAAATLQGNDFTAGPFALVEGARTFHLVALDEAGNRAETTLTVVRDATAPVVTISTPAPDALIGTTSISVTGTTTDPHLQSVAVNGVAATLASGGSSFTAAQVPLVEGDNELVARALDRAGNAAEARRSVTLDTTAPEIAILDPAAGTVVAADSIEVSGSVSDAHLDRVTVGGVAAVVTSGSFRATVALVEGRQTLTATAVDRIGHSAEATVSVERRSTAPRIEIDSPAEGFRTSAGSIAVAGTVEEREGLVVTVAGLPATLSAGRFTVAQIPLVEGENRLIARARDPLGNEGVHTRVVVRDTEAPRFVQSDPADGALAIPAGSALLLTFSEELAVPAASSIRLSSGGAELGVGLELTGETLVVRPSSSLPAGASVSLEATAAIRDLAGNPLANPTTLTFHVADRVLPAAPVLSPQPPAALCAEVVTLTGSAEPGLALLVEGGAGSVSGRADDQGAFSLAVPLAPNALNRLRLYALDASGERSSPAVADLYADCVAPAVVSAERLADAFAVGFSEEIAAASATGSVGLLGAGGPIEGSIELAPDGRSLRFVPAVPVAETAPVRLTVETSIRDLAGNALPSPFVRRFGGEAGESFFAGTALDAGVGRPLAGVLVVVEATDGLPLDLPLEQTTLADGRFQLAVPVGAHRVRFSREGYTPVFRTVATDSTAGVDVFDPRLSPGAPTVTVASPGGRATGSEGAYLDVPAGALAETAAFSVTALSEQALPAVLPLGWSPRGAAWIEVGSSLSQPATLHLPVEAPNGVELVIAALDAATLTWRVVGSAQVSSGAVAISVSRGGGYAALDADRGATAPPAPVPGTPLGASTPGGEVASASVAFDPEQVLPGQRSEATVGYDLGTDPAALPSGTPLTLEVREELRLLGGDVRREPPFLADLSIYRTSDGAPRSKFFLRPSEAAELLPIELGRDDVTVDRYGSGGAGGNVVGPGGGSVTSTEGDRLDIPAGALDAATVVTVSRRTIAELPLALPAGLAPGDVLGIVQLNLGGRTLHLSAALSLALGSAPPSGEDGLLLSAVDRGRGVVLEAVAHLLPTAEGWTTAPIDPLDLPFDGVRRGGFYLFVRTPPLGFFRGTCFGTNGVARGGIEVSVRDSGVRPWLQASVEPNGRYVLPAVVGANTVLARDPATATGGDSVEVSTAIPTAGARVNLDLQLQVIGPRLVSTTPVDGATGVPPGIEPTATFSEAVAPTSLSGAIRLTEIAADGTERTLDAAIEAQGALVRVVPAATLAPETLHELSVGTGVLDLEGNALENAAAIRFTTAEAAPENGALDLTKVSLLEPDASGMARVEGAPGAVPAHTLVVVENATSLVSVPSAEAAADGSFALEVAATVRDTLLLHVLQPGANELVVELGPFLHRDRRGALVGPRGGRFTTVDGYAVGVAGGTFADLTRVRLAPLPTGSEAPALPDWLANGADFTLDFGGATATKPLEIALPRPAGATGDGPFLLLRRIDLDGDRAWMLHDLLRVDGSRLTTTEAPAGQAAPLAVATLTGADAPGGGVVGNAGQNPKAYLPGAAFAGTYRIAAPTVPLAFVAASYPPGGGVSFAFGEDEGIGAAITAAIARLLPGNAILLPVRLGRPVHLVIRDLSSGVLRFDGELGAPPVAGEVTVLPIDALGDQRAPWPVGGSPLRFFALTAAAGDAEILPGVMVRFLGGQLSVSAQDGALPAGIQARLMGIDDGAVSVADSSPEGSLALSVPAVLGRRYVLGLGAKIATNEAIEVRWSEALSADLDGITVLDADGRDVAPTKTVLDVGDTVRLAPESAWQAGGTYTLHLGPPVTDAAGNRWNRSFDLRFTVGSSEVLDTFDLASVREIARLGNWLFVAADADGLVVLDAADPRHLRNAVAPAFAFELPYRDPVRAVAIDAHNRILIAGGGVQGFGQLKVLDPLRFDPAAIAAHPDDPEVRFAAFRGTALISDPLQPDVGTQLPEGAPRKIAILSNDVTDRWEAGSAAPHPLSATLEAIGTEGLATLSVFGDDAAPHAPVTLRSGGRWARVLADESGHFVVDLPVRRGDEVEIKRNQNTLAYVATLGAGIEVVDVNAIFDRPEPTSPRASDLLGVYSGEHDPSLVLCGEGVSDLGSALLDLDGLFDAGNVHPLTIAGSVGNRGLALLESNPQSAGEMSFLSEQCATFDGSRAVAGLETLLDYGFDLDGDGTIAPAERRDYALLAHRVAGVLVYDVTNRAAPHLVGRIRVGSASAITADRGARRLYVSIGAEGIAIVDFDRLPNLDPLDRNGDGRDDRIVETIPLGPVDSGNTNAPVFVAPELGLVFAGGQGRGVKSIAIGHPALYAVDAESGGTGSPIGRLVPFGVPGASSSDTGAFRLIAYLPGVLASAVRFDVASLGASGVSLPPLGPSTGLSGAPSVGYTGSSGITFRRESDDPREDGISRYVSEPIVALGDLRASRAWNRTARENEACVHCIPPVLLPADAKEILSGDSISIRPGSTLATELASIYGAERAASFRLDLPSTRWEMAPSVRQEPRLGANFGAGEAAPGTLLGSGEATFTATDLYVKGRGLDFAFTRTYRSQTAGSGPLGPGWDFGYHVRLRELPTGDVELYDGRLRRERFEKGADGSYRSPKGLFAVLTKSSSGFLLIESDHSFVRFDLSGRLTSIADGLKDSEATGNEMRFEYDAAGELSGVVDSLDRRYALTYRSDGRLIRVADFDGRVVQYRYDDLGRLQEVELPEVTSGVMPGVGARVTRYSYETVTPATATAAAAEDLATRWTVADNLTQILDPRSLVPLALTFTDADGDQRADEVTSEQWGIGTVTLAYDFAAKKTIVTDRRSHATTYQHDSEGRAVRREDPANAVWAWSYDDEGLPVEATLPLGGKTEWTYGTRADRRARGNATLITETPDERGPNGSPATRTTEITYQGWSNRPTRVVDPRGTETTIRRLPTGLPIEIHGAVGTPDETMTRIAHNEHGQPTEIVDPNGHRTTFDYFDAGVDRGYLQRVLRDPAGLSLTTSFDVDARGNVVRRTDPRGVRTDFAWNEADWPVSTMVAASPSSDGAPALRYATHYMHDAIGQLLETEEPDGDDGSGVLKVKQRFGLLGELEEMRHEIGPGTESIVSYDYDENVNRVMITAPNGQKTHWIYDERDLPQAITRGFGAAEAVTETLGFDAEGALIRRVDGRSKVWPIEYDGYGRTMITRDPLGNASEVTYDAGDNPLLSMALDANGNMLAETKAEYDALGRRKKSKQMLWEPGATRAAARELVTTYDYDGVGNLMAITDPLGHATTYHYDSADRLKMVRDAVGNEQEIELDGQGNAMRFIRREQVPVGPPVTVIETAKYDALGRPMERSDALGNTWHTTWDARSRARRTTDPEGATTIRTYDGLDRMVLQERPEGITEHWTYDESSRLRAYSDARNQTTRYDYDPLNREIEIRWPDDTRKTFAFDAAHNVREIRDPNGNVVVQEHDGANRLLVRTITPAPGVVGPTSETYAYDGLSRLTSTTSGGQTAGFEYDSLSRVVRETQNGRAVESTYDDAGNRAALLYPSGLKVGTHFDELDRLRSVMRMGTSDTPVASYGYRGQDLLAERNVGGLSGRMVFDGARRLTATTYQDLASATAFGETLGWNKRNQLTSQSRADLNDAAKLYQYDPAGRITGTLSYRGELPADPTGLDGERFRYDTADNLTEQSKKAFGIDQVTTLPVDPSGRNRPASIHGIPLTWDPNGNLTDKGDLHFEYDYRNRLSRVTRSGQEVATYGYDAFNRRVEKSVDGSTQLTSWSGWQALEKSENGQPTERRIYGNGIDELVQLEKVEAGVSLTYAPVYDAKGNLALLTDANGKIVERANTSTYGQTTWSADSTAPTITQLRLRSGTLELRTSEEVRLAALLSALTSGKATLVETGTNHLIQVLATQPPGITRTRLALTPSTAISPGTELRLRMEPEAIEDLFGHSLDEPFEQTLTWQSTADTVLADTAAPEISHVLLRGASLEVGFSEPLDAAGVAAAILVDGQAQTWTAGSDGEVWTAANVPDGDHTLTIGASPLDLSGKPLAEEFEKPFRIEASHPDQIVYRRPDSSELPTSATGAVLTFQGLELDPETGLLYVRNRYFDPELGRFITADPLGYPDGPSGYGFGAGDAVNGRDPMGLQEGAEIRQRQKDANHLGFDPLHGQESAEAIRRTLSDPYTQGLLQVLGGCSEATLGAISAAGSAGAAAIPGLFAMMHGSDTCAAGLKTLYYGQSNDTITEEGLERALIYSGVPPGRARYLAQLGDGLLGALNSAYASRALMPEFTVLPPPTPMTNEEILDLGKGPLAPEAAANLGASMESKPLALGIDAHLDAFARARGASTWKEFSDSTNWRSGVLDALADNGRTVYFNLDGVDVWEGLQRAASGRGGATDWELLMIKQNPQFWDKLIFWKDGSPVPNPFQ